ncbi:hypothetical protein CMT37_08965 [Elizabethkingia anophelis]|nr:hypothetical protein [Elizabethkingia anophelis]
MVQVVLKLPILSQIPLLGHGKPLVQVMVEIWGIILFIFNLYLPELTSHGYLLSEGLLGFLFSLLRCLVFLRINGLYFEKEA